jgi:hypothetical protein
LNLGSIQKGNYVEEGAQDRQQKAPKLYSDIRVYAETSFRHKILPGSKPLSRTVTITDRLDYSIGRTLPAADPWLRPRFQSFLVIVEAKAQRAVSQALPQLLVYLACIRQSRLQRNRTDASVYGVVSDGYVFIFVKITHHGTVMISRYFDVLCGDMLKVLQSLRFILETADGRCNTGRRLRNAGDLSDLAIDLHDNDYTHPTQDDDEFDF